MRRCSRATLAWIGTVLKGDFPFEQAEQLMIQHDFLTNDDGIVAAKTP